MPTKTRAPESVPAEVPVESPELTPDEFDWNAIESATTTVEYKRTTAGPVVDPVKERAAVPDSIKRLIHASYASFLEGQAKGEAEFGKGHRRVQIVASQTSTRHTAVPTRARGEEFLKHARRYMNVAQIDGADVEMTVRGDVVENTDDEGKKLGTYKVVWRAKPKEIRARKV